MQNLRLWNMTVTTQGGQAKELLVLDISLGRKALLEIHVSCQFSRRLYEGSSLNSRNLVLRDEESGSSSFNLWDACDFFFFFSRLLTACRVQYCICKKYRAFYLSYHFITEVHLHYVIQLAKILKLETRLNRFGSFYFSSKSISIAIEKGLPVKDYYDLWSIKRPTFLKYDFTSGQNQYSINDQQRYFYLTWFSRTSKTFTVK